MRGILIAGLMGLMPLLAGCSIASQITHNLAFEKRLYISDCRLEARIKKDAEDMLREVCHRHANKVFSKEFREGFLDGYRDFLTYGGPIRPPAQAPPHYRTAQYLSPEGHCKVREYFLGFQYGSECAQTTNRRQFFTHLVLMQEGQAPTPLEITVIPPPPEVMTGDAKKPTVPAPMIAPAAPEPKVEPTPVPQVEPVPKVEAPKAAIPTPMPLKPTDLVPKIDPAPKADLVPKPQNTMVPPTVPLPSLPVPMVPTSTSPPPIPLVPMLPTVSLAPPPTAPVVQTGYVPR